MRPWTRKGYRDALDRVLIPRLGSIRIAAISPEHVATLIRELESNGLSSSTIGNYLLPLSGALTFAVWRVLLGMNPCSLLTNDERPDRRERRQDHIWSDEEIEALIQASENLARQPESRYDYSALIRTALFTGLRLGELLGLQWQDVDPRGRPACAEAVDADGRVRSAEDGSRPAANPALGRDDEVPHRAQAALA